MGLVMAVQHWHPYLIRRRFVVRTDHNNLKHLLSQKIVAPAQHFWVTKLLGYDFVIEYKTGTSNVAVDALSRSENDVILASLSGPEWLDLLDILEEQERGEYIKGFVRAISE